MWRSDAASIAPVCPAETTASASPSATARAARTSDESGFARTASTAWSSMSIASEASISGETVRVEARRPHEHRLDVVGRSVDGAADDLVGRMIPTQSVDCDANHARSIYGASRRSGSTSRPLYVLQFGQTRCICFGCLHVGQTWRCGAEIACCARRLSRRDLDVFRFGTAMSGWDYSYPAGHEAPSGAPRCATIPEGAASRARRCVDSTRSGRLSSLVGAIRSRKRRSCETTTSVPS